MRAAGTDVNHNTMIFIDLHYIVTLSVLFSIFFRGWGLKLGERCLQLPGVHS